MDDVPLPRFKLSLLGRFELTGPKGPVDLPSKKLAGLLAYLACTAPECSGARAPHSQNCGRRSSFSQPLWASFQACAAWALCQPRM